MVGIFMITAVFAVVDSLEDELKSTFNILDDDVLFVQKWPWSFGEDYPWWKYVQRREVNIRDMELLQTRLSKAEAVCFQAGASGLAIESGNSRIEGVDVNSVTNEYAQVISLNFEHGRFFAPAESAAGQGLAIVGYDIAMELFGRVDAVGRQVEIKGQSLEVIGVLAQQGASIVNAGFDRIVLVPAKFGLRIMNYSEGTSILLKPRQGISSEELSDELVQQFRSIRQLSPREDDDFAINQIGMLTSILDTIFVQVEWGGWFIGIFALLVGCFSIANIMFVSVRERTRIIGVQKAIGAKSTFILAQFLFEAVALCFFGAFFALILIEMIVFFVNSFDFGITLVVKPSRIIIALILAVSSGLIAGLAPAQRAARMEPVEAMRTNA